MARPTGRPRGRPSKSASINSFARVSKQATVPEKDLDGCITPSQRKRKAAPSPSPEPEEVAATTLQRKSKSTKRTRVQAPEQAPEQAPIVRIQQDEQEQQHVPSTPRSKPSRKRALSPSIEESPRTKEAGNLFKRLRIDASPFPGTARRASPLITASSTRTSTPTTSAVPDSEDDNQPETSNATTPEPEAALPQELLDIVALYAALLKTLSVHYAHNGTNTPVDLRQISQAVSLAWGKRRISLADVRRCVGVMNRTQASPFYLVDYGNKKVCVELGPEYQGKLLDEAGLLVMFEENLRKIWEAVKDAAEADMAAFVLGLPKASVQTCDSIAKASPLLAKGQRAMAELKKGIEERQQEKEAAKASTQTAPTADGTTGQKLSLLERLRLKEAQLAQLAATGPTAAELEREAALARADDIAAVIAMLAKSAPAPGMGGRVSFTMATVLQKLKDSLRLPISKEEAAACVRLLAGEVAPEWLKIVKIGAKENVVVTVGRALSSTAVTERVKALSG